MTSAPDGNSTTSGIITTTTQVRELSDGNPVGNVLGQRPADLIGFFGTQPIVQPAQPTAHDDTFTNVGTVAIYGGATFTGAVGTSAYTVGDVVAAMKNLGLLAE